MTMLYSLLGAVSVFAFLILLIVRMTKKMQKYRDQAAYLEHKLQQSEARHEAHQNNAYRNDDALHDILSKYEGDSPD